MVWIITVYEHSWHNILADASSLLSLLLMNMFNVLNVWRHSNVYSVDKVYVKKCLWLIYSWYKIQHYITKSHNAFATGSYAFFTDI